MASISPKSLLPRHSFTTHRTPTPLSPLRFPLPRRLPNTRVRVSAPVLRANLDAIRPGGAVETDKLPSDVRDRAMKAVDSSGGRVTIGDVASRAGLKVGEAERALQALAADTGGFLEVGALLDNVKWDDKGLAVAIAQNIDTGAILMQGFANREALATTISSRKATFYSRSRLSLWTKGETSTNFINIHDIFLDCDRDSIIYLGKPDGPTCHTGAETCYYSSVFGLLEEPQARKECFASTTLYSLEETICQREEEIETIMNGKPSWTKRLLLDKELLSSKVREEAGELIQTLLENEDRSRTASEMADLLYHAMVLLRVKGVKVEEVLEVLRKRFSQSGVEEKTSRKKSSNQS